ncbi:MAG: hypothetical protein J6L72_09260 [Butyricicoccus sp.]|nr:hypothetical protein [Butyricicoccus sp.]
MLSTVISTALAAAQKAASTKKSSSSGVGSSSVAFDKDFDYAEAIANTSDPVKRAQLLQARQAKIDALGLEGSVGSNEAVSQWSGSYRPYWVSDGNSGALSVTGLYDAAAKARLQAFETAKQNIQKQLESQYSDIDRAYRQGMTQADVNARRSALGNEEKLAALGLSMGGAYGAPTSGYTETSRVAVDNAYRSDLNGLAEARLNARSAAAQNAAAQQAGLLSGYDSGEASAALQQAQSQLSQLGADRDYSISLAGLTGYINGMPTLSNQQMQAAGEQTAYEQAMERWKAYGYVLPADAALLGVSAGTPTSDQSYRSAQLQLDRIKTFYQTSR